ncbi:MAG: YihY/virulence factor BrkB family protein [Bacteroidota bacterium]|nr:YihY/virulence factor BrkB family protein [Flavisolibacter sp.]MDQ3847170.1 YihY/virulence factor BrkB family protein [Bacteroidota bacterium]
MTKKKKDIYQLPRLLSAALKDLLKNDPLRMAGATAFFTTFALPPILVILIQVLRLVLDPQQIRLELYHSLSDIVGPEAVQQLREVIQSFRRLAQNWYITIGGFLFLVFVATTLFKVIQGSLNQIWQIRPHKEKGLLKGLRTRFHSILVILVAGVLFVIGIMVEGARAFIGKYIFDFSPLLSVYFNTIVNSVFSIIIVTLWFVIMFRYLPDGRPDWPVAFAGSFLTALLFTVGKIVLHWLLTYSNINTLYGTSASIVLLLLFVFYSAMILYYGAAFTKVWGTYKRRPILPLPHAMYYKLVETEVEGKKAEE